LDMDTSIEIAFQFHYPRTEGNNIEDVPGHGHEGVGVPYKRRRMPEVEDVPGHGH